jgi:hypothetical protein
MSASNPNARLPDRQDDDGQPVLREVIAAIRSLRYGTVEVVIHAGKVVQIERREKIRFDASGTSL